MTISSLMKKSKIYHISKPVSMNLSVFIPPPELGCLDLHLLRDVPF
jgi:hypothetical protein